MQLQSPESEEEEQIQKQFKVPDEGQGQGQSQEGACAPSTSLGEQGCDVFIVEDLCRFSHLGFPFCHAMVSLQRDLVHSWAQVCDCELEIKKALLVVRTQILQLQ